MEPEQKKIQEKNILSELERTPASDQVQIKQPKWVKRLERESWQAELVISGMALYGSFHLPKFVDSIAAYLIKHLQTELYYLGYIITYLLLMGISIITVFFTLHFLYRAYWIGLIGLNSVFPQGIRTHGGMYSPRYLERAKKDLPEIKESILKIDKICSTIFSGAIAFAMFSLGCTIAFGITLIITVILSKYFSTQLALVPFYLLATAYALATVYFVYNNREKKWSDIKSQDRLYKVSNIFSLIFINVFKKPSTQIITTFYSYYDKKDKSNKKKGNLPILFFVISIVYLVVLFVNSDVPLFLDGSKENFSNTRANTVQTKMYSDQSTLRSGVLNPIIPSEIIESGFVKLFVPVLPNESSLINSVCGKFEKDKEVSRDKNRSLRSDFRLACFERTHQIKLDGKRITEAFIYHQYPHSNEEGFLCYIPTSNLEEGKHLISVTKFADAEYKEIKREFVIPFWYAP